MLTTLATIGTVTSLGLLWRLKGQWADYHRGQVGRPALVNSVLLTGGGVGLTVLAWVVKLVMG